MLVNWADLGTVFGATVGAAVVIAVLFSFGVIGLSRQAETKDQGVSGAAPFAGAVVCFAVCVALVGYGIYLIVAK